MICDLTSCLLHLLLLYILTQPSQCAPAHDGVFCNALKSAFNQMDTMRKTSEQLRHPMDELVEVFLEAQLLRFPVISTTAAHFDSLKAEECLSQLYLHTLALKAHVDWIKEASENFSFPYQAARDTSVHLLWLTNLVSTSLAQINAVVPPSPPPPLLPTVSSPFEVLRYSVEISRYLEVFCPWAKRLFHHLRRTACGRQR
ncbi:uncharacterized protein LOC144206463 isoform X2 [Stigmatopora nigra]